MYLFQLNRFTDHTVEAVKAKEKARELRRTRDKQQEKGRQQQQQYKAAQDELAHINEKIDIMKGPFQTRFDNTLAELRVKRQIYHKGALVGNDVAKILQSIHIKQIVHVFQPIEIKLKHGEKQVFSGHKLMSKISTMLTKLSQCFKLYSASAPLCHHEIAILGARCASFGQWFPVNFPNTNLLRKFHILTFHVPEKAILRGTVGMEAEHCSESIHPVVNKLDRMYATTQNTCDRLALVAKSQRLQSESTLTNFNKPRKRNQCKLVLHEE